MHIVEVNVYECRELWLYLGSCGLMDKQPFDNSPSSSNYLMVHSEMVNSSYIQSFFKSIH